jgi:RNA polymerase sigma factor (sigma-70 family)
MTDRPLTRDRRDRLAVRHLPLARSISRPYRRIHPDLRHDFESAASLALLRAARSFDPGRNVRFATYARYRIVGALRDVLRRQSRCMPGPVPTTAARLIGIDIDFLRSGRTCDLCPPRPYGWNVTCGPDEPIGVGLERDEQVEVWLARLPVRHAAVLRSLYFEGRAARDVARNLNLSRTKTYVLIRDSLARLRRIASRDDERSSSNA